MKRIKEDKRYGKKKLHKYVLILKCNTKPNKC